MNLSEKIQQTQDELIDLREQLKTASEMYIEDATDENQETVAELTKQIQDAESKLKTMQDAEQAIMDQLPAQPAAAKTPNAPAKKPVNKAPAIVTSVKNYEEGEIFFKQAAVTALAHIQRVPITDVLRDRYRNDKGLEAIMTKADSVIGTTTGTN